MSPADRKRLRKMLWDFEELIISAACRGASVPSLFDLVERMVQRALESQIKRIP